MVIFFIEGRVPKPGLFNTYSIVTYMDALMLFWQQMPGEMRAFLGIIIGASIHYAKNRGVPIGEGLIGMIIGIIVGIIIVYGFVWAFKWDLKEIWFIGAIAGYMANSVVTGLDRTGKDIETQGLAAWISNYLIDAIAKGKEQIFGKKP